MSKIYPPIQPYDSFKLSTIDGHSLHVEQSGNAEGIPVLYLHGGPGGGIAPFIRRVFNPRKYRLISFDQRGCGQSTPFLSLENNTSDHLLGDIEQLRQHLHIPQWLVCGGSWGSTLSLLYAIKHPEMVSGMILRGIFLGRQQDLDWLLHSQGGAAQVFSDQYQYLIEDLPRQNLSTSEIIKYFYQQFTGHNELQRIAGAKRWSSWEMHIAQMHCVASSLPEESMHTVLSLAVLECHYMHHHCFIDEGFILNNVQRIADIPGILIHGRYDMVCKIEGAHKLHQHWPNSELCIVPNAAHSGSDPLIANAFCKATDAMAEFLKQKSP